MWSAGRLQGLHAGAAELLSALCSCAGLLGRLLGLDWSACRTHVGNYKNLAVSIPRQTCSKAGWHLQFTGWV